MFAGEWVVVCVIDGLIDYWKDRWMDGLMDGCIDRRCMDGQMDSGFSAFIYQSKIQLPLYVLIW